MITFFFFVTPTSDISCCRKLLQTHNKLKIGIPTLDKELRGKGRDDFSRSPFAIFCCCFEKKTDFNFSPRSLSKLFRSHHPLIFSIICCPSSFYCWVFYADSDCFHGLAKSSAIDAALWMEAKSIARLFPINHSSDFLIIFHKRDFSGKSWKRKARKSLQTKSWEEQKKGFWHFLTIGTYEKATKKAIKRKTASFKSVSCASNKLIESNVK